MSTGPRPPQPCGTPAAYDRHKTHGETPCKPCHEAKAIRNRDYKRKIRAQANTPTPPLPALNTPHADFGRWTLPAWAIRRAQLNVCGDAKDAADARVLLDALGIRQPATNGRRP